MIIQIQLNQLAKWEYNISGDTFVKKYIKFNKEKVSDARVIEKAESFWAKFKHYNHSVLSLYGYADIGNRVILTKMINSGYRR